MSGANIELVRHVYEHWISGDFSRGDAFDPEVEFEMPDWPEGTRTRGREAMARTWLGTLAAWEDFRAAPGQFFEAGDRASSSPTSADAAGEAGSRRAPKPQPCGRSETARSSISPCIGTSPRPSTSRGSTGGSPKTRRVGPVPETYPPASIPADVVHHELLRIIAGFRWPTGMRGNS
jgi:SnoaL-like domain